MITSVSLFPRLGLIATCLAFVACGSSPDPKSAGDEDRAASTKRKKKKKKKRKTAEEIEAEERAAAKVRAHREDRRRVAEAKKSSPFGRTSRDDNEEQEEEPEEEKPAKADKPKQDEKPAKAEKAKPERAKPQKPKAEPKLAKAEKPVEEEPEEAEEVTIVDDEDVEPDPVKKKGKPAKAKKKPPPKKVAKKPAREEPEPEADEVAADTRKGVEKPAKKEPEPEIDEELEEEPPPKAKPKKQVVAAKAKRAEPKRPEPKKKREPEPEIEPEIEIDEPEPDRRSQAEVLSSDTEEDDPLKERRVAAIAVPGVDDGESDEPEEAELPPGAWPTQINDRPLTLAKDKLAVHGGLRYSSLTIRPPGGTPTTTNTTALALGATYGLGEKLEVGLDYALGVSPASAKGPFTLHGAYRASAGAKLELAIAGGFAVDFAEVTDAMMQTQTVSSYALVLGAWARYHVNRKASLFTGLPATPGVPVTLSKVAFPLPPLPYHATIGLSEGSAIAVDVPFGAGYQLKQNIYMFGALNLAHIRVRNTANAFLFKDIIPVTVGGFYTRKTMDIGVQLSDDLRSGTDNLRLDLLLRYGVK